MAESEKSPEAQRLERAERAYEGMMLCADRLRETIEKLKLAMKEKS